MFTQLKPLPFKRYNINAAIEFRSEGIEDAYGNKYPLGVRASIAEASCPGFEMYYLAPTELELHIRHNRTMTRKEYYKFNGLLREYYRNCNTGTAEEDPAPNYWQWN